MTDRRARDIFHIGQRVKLTPDGIGHLGHGSAKAKHDANLRGTVRGFGYEAALLRVQRDGIKSTDTYHMDFWEAE